MQSEQVKLPQDNNQLGNLCAICGKIITKNDLVHILVEDTEDVVVHFKCFVEVHDKICCECGMPFKDKEELLYCEEHKDYFHMKEDCQKRHMRKHQPFKHAEYSTANNRIKFLDSDENE
ncbi:MAG: hypothetical protein ACTSPK_00420 [Candidatus Heimdallarchaeota archaeon]